MLHSQSLALRVELDDKATLWECLWGIAAVASAQGNALCAARLLAAIEGLLHAAGAVLPPLFHADTTDLIAAVRAQLSEEAFAEAWAAGRGMTLDQAVAVARAESDILLTASPDS